MHRNPVERRAVSKGCYEIHRDARTAFILGDCWGFLDKQLRWSRILLLRHAKGNKPFTESVLQFGTWSPRPALLYPGIVTHGCRFFHTDTDRRDSSAVRIYFRVKKDRKKRGFTEQGSSPSSSRRNCVKVSVFVVFGALLSVNVDRHVRSDYGSWIVCGISTVLGS
ncbi:hypothetical protein JOB18_045081 [Solea senegalensis]|uniref:Uncharacterized protein n=1 Tax=Solea senegalensis TaxID=28829 RepID=A0AAV6Q8P2_SOLSE|nr:hypothetical protein JOB18_045081 [Solea senegalensis]